MANGTEAPKPADQVNGFNKNQVALWRPELSALGARCCSSPSALPRSCSSPRSPTSGRHHARLAVIVPACCTCCCPAGSQTSRAPTASRSGSPRSATTPFLCSATTGAARPVLRGCGPSSEAERRASSTSQDIAPSDPVVLILTSARERSTQGRGRLRRGWTQPRASGSCGAQRGQDTDLLHGRERLPPRDRCRCGRRRVLLDNIENENLGPIRGSGMITTTVAPGTSVADALRTIENQRTDALLVTVDGRIKRIVERDPLANAMLLTILDRVSGRGRRERPRRGTAGCQR